MLILSLLNSASPDLPAQALIIIRKSSGCLPRFCFGYPLWTGDGRSDLTFIGHNACYRPFLFCVHLMSANVLLYATYWDIFRLGSCQTYQLKYGHDNNSIFLYFYSAVQVNHTRAMRSCVSLFNFNRCAHLLMGLAIIERQSQLDTAHLVNDKAFALLLSLTNAAINYKLIMVCSLNIILIRHYIAPNL